MKSFIFIDKEKGAFGKVLDNKLYELKFYNPDLHNIYRARIVDKIDSINAYFLLYEDDKKAFLKTRKKFKIGDSVIGQIIKEGFDEKLATFSANFRIENDRYYLYRFKNRGYPRLKKGQKKDQKAYNDLVKLKEKLIREENFSPSPKLLKEISQFEIYKKENEDLDIVSLDIKNNMVIKDGLDRIKNDKLYKDGMSIIINELETMTVVDINSSKKKSKMKKDDFFYWVNKSMVDLIFFNLNLRNIGGMVVIDFLRSLRNDELLAEIEKSLEKYFDKFEIYGFTKMGLFEISLKREGKPLKENLKKLGLI